MLCDVSRSMQPTTTAYLHLMRAAAVRTPTEVFAFAHPADPADPGARAPLGRARRRAGHRPGGRPVRRHPDRDQHRRRCCAPGTAPPCAAATVVIASDGWDTDPPDALDRAMARLRRRAHAVIWVNPRRPRPGTEPLVGGMAAALPHCDELLPGHSLRTLLEVIDAITRGRRLRASSAPEGHVDGGPEVPEVDPRPAQHRLRRPGRGDEPQQLGGDRRPAVPRRARRPPTGPAPWCPGPCSSTSRPVRRSSAAAKATASATPRCRRASSMAAAWLWKIRMRSSGTANRRSVSATSPSTCTADGPSSQVCSRSCAGVGRVPASGWSGPVDEGDPVVEERQWRRCRRSAAPASGPMATSTARVRSRVVEPARRLHAQLDVEVVGPPGEQLDQPGRGVLGEQAGRGDLQHPAARARPGSPRAPCGPAGPASRRPGWPAGARRG